MCNPRSYPFVSADVSEDLAGNSLFEIAPVCAVGAAETILANQMVARMLA